MSSSLLFVCLAVVLVHIHHIVFLVQGQCVPVNCRYADSMLADGICFRLNETQVHWGEGKAFCAGMKGSLAMFKSPEQIDKAIQILRPFQAAWIGANDINVEGKYIWDHDKSPVAASLIGLWFGRRVKTFYDNPRDCLMVYNDPLGPQVSDYRCKITSFTLCMEMPLGAAYECPKPATHESFFNASQETPSQETSTLKISPQETSHQRTSPQETSTQATLPQETSIEEASTQETSTQEILPHKTYLQETSPQQKSLQETSTQETSIQETSYQETPSTTTQALIGGIEPVKLSLAIYIFLVLVVLYLKHDEIL